MSEENLTMSVPDAGLRFFGMSRDASYAAARSGHLPIIRLGKRKVVVPVRVVERMLGIETEEAAQVE